SAPQMTPQLPALEDRMKTIFPDSLTPIDALSLLYELRALADSKDAQKP
ncbi:MAG: hypothetical protein QMC17_00965, partial [Paracoccaceae bacterium]